MARNLSSPKPATRPGHSRICDLNVEVRPVSDLDVRTQNPRTHSIKQIRQIIESVKTFGWTNPMLIDEENRVVAGHGRHEAAKMLGMDHVPTIKLTNMTSNLQRSRSESGQLDQGASDV